MSVMNPALERFISAWKPVADAVIDSWFIVDAERRIVEYNRAFYGLMPRSVARSIKGRRCHELLELEICQERCIAEQCWRVGKHVRLDEINGRPTETEQPMRFLLSALPILDEAGQAVGALEIQRNVTDEAVVQSKYQEILDQEARERERLAGQIRTRNRELIETNRLLVKVQEELLRYRRGLDA